MVCAPQNNEELRSLDVNPDCERLGPKCHALAAFKERKTVERLVVHGTHTLKDK